MSRKIDVIVQEIAVKGEATAGNPRAQEVMQVIEGIREFGLNKVIDIDSALNKVDSEMPPPSQDLEVLVSGAYKDAGVASQLFALRIAGYNASFHPTACLAGEKKLPQHIVDIVLERFPDFFEDPPFVN